MKVFIYKNGMCDPKAKLGTIKKLNKAEEVDSFIKAMCASMTPLAHNYGLDLRSNSIKEVDTLEVAADCSKKMAKVYERRNQRIKMLRE